MTTLDERPRQQLAAMLAQFGRSICADPKRCAAVLHDLCPESKREINLLVAALKEKVVEDLLNNPSTVPVELIMRHLSQRLTDNWGIAENFANWAVESWALSLQIISQPLPFIHQGTVSEQQIGKYTVRNDGVAIDTETGLMWLRFAYGQQWINNNVQGVAQGVIWRQAFKVADSFNRHGGYAGFNNWRLPTIHELRRLIDTRKGKPGNYIDADVFPANKGQWFWSSSPYVNGSYGAWIVVFEYGFDSYDDKNYSHAVRFVRNNE